MLVEPLEPRPEAEEDEEEEGLLAGMLIFLTLSLIIWRIVFKNAFRKSEVLLGGRKQTKKQITYKPLSLHVDVTIPISIHLIYVILPIG